MKHAGANLQAMRLELFPSDYQSLAHLHFKLAALFGKAKAHGQPYRNSVVALPGHIDTWLVLSEGRSIPDTVFSRDCLPGQPYRHIWPSDKSSRAEVRSSGLELRTERAGNQPSPSQITFTDGTTGLALFLRDRPCAPESLPGIDALTTRMP